MKKLLLSIMALAAINFAEAKKVKFQVDMTGQTVGGNGVHIAGDFQAAAGFPGDWQPGATAMSNGGSGNIYSVIVDIPANTFYRFKFINGNDWPQVESVPAINQKGHVNNGQSDDNRWWYIDSTANDTSTLPAIMFGGSAPANQYAVRFAVDMQKEATVSANGVHIAGSLQGWDPSKTSMANLFSANNKVYEWVAYLDSGSYEYKYVNGNAWGSDEGIPTACKVNGNRGISFTTDLVVPKVCYGACEACPSAPIPVYNITFRIDMTNSVCDGGYDSVTVAGAKIKNANGQNWGDGAQTMSDGNNDKVFEITLPIDSGECEFKYRLHKNGSTSWEGIANRIIALTSDSVLTVNCFNSTSACTTLPAPSDITFKVDLSLQTPDKVYVMGTFQLPNWQAGALRMNPVSGQPGIYQLTVSAVCPGSFSYKFINGDSSVSNNEESFPDPNNRGCTESNGNGGFNRVYTRTSAAPVTLFYMFDSCTALPSTGIDEKALNAENFKLYPNPAEQYTIVEFNDNATAHNIEVIDLAGRVLQSYIGYKQNTILINLDEMKAGLYFIKASNTRNESVSSKLIVR